MKIDSFPEITVKLMPLKKLLEKNYEVISELSFLKKKKQQKNSCLCSVFSIYCFLYFCFLHPNLHALPILLSSLYPDAFLLCLTETVISLNESLKCPTIWITTYGMNELSFLFSSWRKKSMSKLAISFTN